MDWKTKRKPKATKNEYGYLIWVYDSQIEIGYCSPDVAYLDSDNSWVNYVGDYIETDCISVTAWCRLEKPKNKKFPTIE